MGTTYTGQKVQDTYQSIIKVSDNTNLTGTAKLLSDGLGNDTVLYLSTSKLGVGVSPTFQFQTSGTAKIGSHLEVGGNLTVNGTTTIVDSTIIAIGDNMIEMAKDNVANTLDIGWYGTINSSGEKYVGMFYDASDGVSTPTFRIGLGTVEPSGTAAWTVKGKLVIGALDATTGVFSGQVTIPITPVANTDAASKGYVDSQITAQDLDIAGDSGTGAVDLDSQTFTISGGSNVTTSVSGQTVTINATGAVDGSGTANDVVMWQDSDTLTDAPIAISGNDASFAGLITATKTQDAQSLFKFINASTGTSSTSRVVAEADAGSVQLIAAGSNYSGVSGAWQDAGVVCTSSMSGGLILASDNGVAINANGGTRALTISASDQSATFAGNVQVGTSNANYQAGFGVAIGDKVLSYGAEFQATNADIQIVLGRNNGTSVQGTGAIGASATNAFHVYDTSSIVHLFQVAQSSGNATFAGNVSLGDDKKILLGSGEDIKIYHNSSSTNANIENHTGHLYITNYADDKDIKFLSDNGSGGTEVYFELQGVSGGANPFTVFSRYVAFGFR